MEDDVQNKVPSVIVIQPRANLVGLLLLEVRTIVDHASKEKIKRDSSSALSTIFQLKAIK